MSWQRSVILIGFLVLVVGVGGWLWFGRRTYVSPSIDAAAFANWPIAASDGTDPWVVAMTPPERLLAVLTAEAVHHAGRPLVAPPHAGVPLVLRGEFEEGLQGVYGTDSVMRMAHDAGLDARYFQPACLAHQTRSDAQGRAELYFVPLDSAAFSQVRVDLIPAFPEQAGTGIYDPSTVSPVLVIGATDANFERWWPLRVDRERDCIASVAIAAPAQN